jgi:hypothetical protein
MNNFILMLVTVSRHIYMVALFLFELDGGVPEKPEWCWERAVQIKSLVRRATASSI